MVKTSYIKSVNIICLLYLFHIGKFCLEIKTIIEDDM
jgi:hypothetical protein